MPIFSTSRAMLLTLALPSVLAAQEFTVTPLTEPRPKDPTYALPLVPTRTVRFTTDEGTWMSVDVSPDGRTIVFDLLGDLYTVPITGGKATRIMGGMAVDMQPRYSPDGTQIVFISDRSGQDNIWLVDADGRHPRPLARAALDTAFEVKDGTHQPPVWTPDGRFIVVDGTWYDVLTGTAAPLLETGGQLVFGGSVRRGYVANGTLSLRGPGIDVYDLSTGRLWPLFRSIRPVFQPAVSRDERWLVYGTAIDGETSLRVRDLRTGEDTWLTRDVQPAEYDSKIPTFAFTPDGRAIVMTTGGKLWRVAVPSGERTLIPFQADVEIDMGPLAQFQYPVTDSLTVRQIREPRLSPDGKRLAFIALDKLYLMDFPDGTPRRATTAVGVVENYPAWSPDGRYVAFSTYHDLTGGHIYRVEASRVLASGPRAAPQRLTRESDLYTRLAYTPDGRRLVFGRTPWRRLQQHVHDVPTLPVELRWMNADGGAQRLITRVTERWRSDFDPGAPPQFLSTEPDRLVVPSAGMLVSLRWDGSDPRTVIRWPAGTPPYEKHGIIPSQVVLSPDGTHALVTYYNNVYLATLPPGPRDSLLIDAGASRPVVPLRRLSRYGAEFPAWSADGKQVYFALGRSLFVCDVAAGEARFRDSLRAADTRQPLPPAVAPARYDVTVVVPRDRAQGTLALRGARLITMKGDEVIARGDLVIRDGRIVAVGPSGTVTIPKGARSIDVTGTTILPGYVDLHAHIKTPTRTHKTQLPRYLAYLAYGVTTVRDPGRSDHRVTYGDRVEVGDLLGPRVLVSGLTGGAATRVFADDSLTSLATTREVLRRYAEFYQTQVLKQYTAGNRLIRQWIVMASHELGVSPTTEGARNWKKAISELIDGYAGHEHSHPIYPLYRDFVLLTAASGNTYDPTLIVDNTGEWVTPRMIHREHPHDDPKLRRFTEHAYLDAAVSGQGNWRVEGEYTYAEAARSAAKIVAAGGYVGIGGHGELHGLDTHWELWLLGSGGLSNLEVLRAGTLTGARALGLDRDLGSLEPGKLADLQVLEGNPLENLRNTTTLRYVMRNGRLYDADTLDELWPRRRKLGPQWWQLDEPPPSMTESETILSQGAQ